MKNKKIYFGTNLKMYKGNAETIKYLTALSHAVDHFKTDYDIELFVIPSYTCIKDATTVVDSIKNNKKIIIGAQNMNANDNGQFTGEISPPMLKEAGATLVMIGHSERRHVMKETDQEENEKVISALSHGFTTLLCIGETLEQKNYNLSDEVLRTQLKIGLYGVKKHQLSKLWIAYEPVWAIGKDGIPATAEYANEKHAVIKQCLSELFAEDGHKIPVLYGGSVNPENSNKLIIQPHIDGLFVGRSAWDGKKFPSLIQNALNALSVHSSGNSTNEYTHIAEQLIACLGGKENIQALTHCATRIRVVVDNELKADKLAIEKVDKTKGIFTIANQYQIIFGDKLVEKIYFAMAKILSK